MDTQYEKLYTKLYGDEGSAKFTIAKDKSWEIGASALDSLTENGARIFVSPSE